MGFLLIYLIPIVVLVLFGGYVAYELITTVMNEIKDTYFPEETKKPITAQMSKEMLKQFEKKIEGKSTHDAIINNILNEIDQDKTDHDKLIDDIINKINTKDHINESIYPPAQKDPCTFNCSEPYGERVDLDSDTKGGGKDPLLIRGTWDYFDFDAQRCSNAPNSFDYDNDGFPEHMCYWYTKGSQILFNDKDNGALVNGNNFIGNFTHIWEDKNMNVFVDEGELTQIVDPQLRLLVNYPEGRKIAENGRYIYCVGESLTYDWEFECTKPTYWKTQEWMK